MMSRTAAVLASTLLAVLVFAASAHATFPGANGKIAFDCSGANGNGICVTNPDGTGTTQLVTNPYKYVICFADRGCDDFNARDMVPRWAPDGRSLIFQREIGATAPPFPPIQTISRAYFRVNADGSGLTQLSNTQDGFRPVAWSPDGRRIALGERVDTFPHLRIVVQNIDGTQRTTLTAADADAFGPAWSPDGSTIAYAFSHPTLPGQVVPDDIHLINPDGTNDRAITSAPPDCLVNSVYPDPNWSPDGRRLVAMHNQSCFGPLDIVVMNADGSGITYLTNLCCATSQHGPVWSPDGTQIVFDREFHLIVMNADGSNQHDIGPGVRPDWQPITGPQRSDYKNAAWFCKAEREFLGDAAFARKYGSISPKKNVANAYGKCVSAK